MIMSDFLYRINTIVNGLVWEGRRVCPSCFYSGHDIANVDLYRCNTCEVILPIEDNESRICPLCNTIMNLVGHRNSVCPECQSALMVKEMTAQCPIRGCGQVVIQGDEWLHFEDHHANGDI